MSRFGKRKVKFVWDIFVTTDGRYIQVNLNGDCNTMIPLGSVDTLEENKANVKGEILRWSDVHETVVNGMDLLES